MRCYNAKDYIPDNYCFFIRHIVRNDSLLCHMHDFVEIVYVISGTAVHHIKKSSYELSAGMLYVIDVGHSHQMDSSDTVEYYELMIEKDFFDNSQICEPLRSHMQEGGSPAMRIETARQQSVESILKALVSELAASEEMPAAAPSLMDAFFLISGGSKPVASGELLTAKKNRSISNIIDYINNHYEENISLSTIAKLYNYNASYLSRHIKKRYGVSYTEYINHLRIKQARRLLMYTNYSIKQIEHMVGYSGHTTFYKEFAKKYNTTPQKYRYVNQTLDRKQNIVE